MGSNIKLLTFDVDSATQLSLIRNVGEKGYGITLLTYKNKGLNRMSKYVNTIIQVNNWNENEQLFLKYLVNIGEKEPFNYIIISTSDLINLFLANNYDKLKNYFYFSFNEPNIIKLLINKNDFYNKMNELKINIPETYFLNNENELDFKVNEIGYPIIIKPNCMYDEDFHKYFNNKILKIYNENEYEKYRNDLIKIYDKIILQKLIKGDKNLATYGYFYKGDFVFAIECIKDYMDSWGTTIIGHSANVQSLREYSKEILRKIGYEGFAELEFLFDEDSKEYKLIEINSRPVQWCRLCSFVGEAIEDIPMRIINGADGRGNPSLRGRENRYVYYENANKEDVKIRPMGEENRYVYYEIGLLELYRDKKINLKEMFIYINSRSAVSMYYDKNDLKPSIRNMLSFYKGLVKVIMKL